ncbi:MAG TPA: IclR family transcriptional regulator [Casimicrobiaceae bacterium]|nr:IclR family transcriptional regulator [Casimicrobiaceae bacterium]
MTVAAVHRCVDVLECLAGAVGGLELGDIASRVGSPKSGVHRLLATLVERGLVVQDADSGHYVLSLRFSMLAFRDLDARVVTDVAQEVLDALARRTQEYCRLGVVEGESIAWVARAQGATAGLRYDADMGQEVALHATATGKAWLATLPEEDALRVVCARGFFAHLRLGPRALTTVESLKRQLAATRARGYAVAVEEAEPGIVALAATFRTDPRPDAPVAGTLSVAGPVSRITPERYPQIHAALAEAVSALESMWRLRVRQRGRPRQYGPKAAPEPAAGRAGAKASASTKVRA